MSKLTELKPKISTLSGKPMLHSFTDTERIRGTTLQNIRKAHFAQNPLCVACLARTPPRTRVATQLDHTMPLHQGGRDDHTNRQGLCDECHNEKTITERGDIVRNRKPGGA